ncbi:MAG: hypothetical protein U1E62_18530 [Alsobacter sp.]
MSSQNDNSGAYVGFAFIAAGLYIAGLFLFALAAFAAFVLTILSVLAWHKPLRLGKDTVITPEEAQGFIKRGLIGAVALPVFVVFAAILLNFDIRDDAWGYIVIGGYVGGSLILEMMIQNQKEKEEQAQAQAAMLMMLPPAPPPATPPLRPALRERAPDDFRFASWDDEEEFDERS